MELYLLRHAIAEEITEVKRGGDRARALTDEGRDKMRQVAEGMKTSELEFDLILSSPYVRARETAEIVANKFKLEDKLLFSDLLTPDGDVRGLIARICEDHRDCERVLLVGHEPFMSGMVSLLTCGDGRLSLRFKKAGLCKLTVSELRFGKCAVFEWLLTPGQLRMLHRG
jgi:phosphohistidine phosphatase